VPYCPECGGDMKYTTKIYICQICGLTVTQQELFELKEKNMCYDDDDPKEARRKEYLKWWLNKK